jgi:hypothetical protein
MGSHAAPDMMWKHLVTYLPLDKLQVKRRGDAEESNPTNAYAVGRKELITTWIKNE